MNIEDVLPIILPSSAILDESIHKLRYKQLNSNDIVTALQLSKKASKLGAALFDLKHTQDKSNLNNALKIMNQFITPLLNTTIIKGAGKNIKNSKKIISQFAVAAYICRPESQNSCLICNGTGLMNLNIDKKDGSEQCLFCSGLGKILRCRCGGTGFINRRKDSRRTGGNTCERCKGHGYRPLKAIDLRRALESGGVSIKRDTFARHWWPCFKKILEEMKVEEDKVARAFVDCTR